MSMSGRIARQRSMPSATRAANAERTTSGDIPAPVDLADQDRLHAYKIVEDARQQFLTWLKWTFGAFLLFAGVIGVKGYSDWTSLLEAQRAGLDGKIREHVSQHLRENYQARADEVLASAVKARTEIATATSTLADLQSRSTGLKKELDRFQDKISAVEAQVQSKATEVSGRLDRLAADFEGPAAHSTQRLKERNFLASGRAYAARLALTLPEPKIVFRTAASAPDSVLATYDLKTGEYVVNPSKLETPGLPESSALMGRFFEKNQDVLKNVDKPGYPDSGLWQNVRMSIVAYLLTTDGLPVPALGFAADQSLYRLFKAVEQRAGVDSARRLAVGVLESFDRNWRTANTNEKVVAVNARVKAVPDVDLQEALQHL